MQGVRGGPGSARGATGRGGQASEATGAQLTKGKAPQLAPKPHCSRARAHRRCGVLTPPASRVSRLCWHCSHDDLLSPAHRCRSRSLITARVGERETAWQLARAVLYGTSTLTRCCPCPGEQQCFPDPHYQRKRSDLERSPSLRCGDLLSPPLRTDIDLGRRFIHRSCPTSSKRLGLCLPL